MEAFNRFLDIDLEAEWDKEYKRLGNMYAFWGSVMVILFYPTAIFPELQLEKDNEQLWYFFRAMPSIVVGITFLLYRTLKFRHEIMFEVVAIAIFMAGAYRPNCQDWLSHLINNITLFLTAAILTILRPYYFVINFFMMLALNIGFYMFFCQKSFADFWLERGSAIFVVSGIASFAIAIFRYRILKNNFQQRFALQKATNELANKNAQLEEAQEELTGKNEEILSQNEQLKQQKEEILTQRDEIEQQKNAMERTNRNIISSITYAKRIQEAVLPTRQFFLENFQDFFVFYQPKDIVSGDFFWTLQTEEHIFIAVADCTGHGVPGAFMTMLGSTILSNIVLVKKLHRSDEILHELDREILYMLKQDTSGSQDGMDITLCIIDKNKSKLQVSSAHNPFLYVQKGAFHVVKASVAGIGGNIQKNKVFEAHDIALDADTYIYMTTDGLQDQFGGQLKRKYSSKKLQQRIQDHFHLPMQAQHDFFQKEINEWMEQAGEHQIDDITLMGIKV